jgi:hypothetical protein
VPGNFYKGRSQEKTPLRRPDFFLLQIGRTSCTNFWANQLHTYIAILTRAPPSNRGYYAECSHRRALTMGDLGHLLHISTVCT